MSGPTLRAPTLLRRGLLTAAPTVFLLLLFPYLLAGDEQQAAQGAAEAVQRYLQAWQQGDVWTMYSLLDQQTRSRIPRSVFVGSLLKPETVDGKVVGVIRFHPSEVSVGQPEPVKDTTRFAVPYRVVFRSEDFCIPLDALGREGEDVLVREALTSLEIPGGTPMEQFLFLHVAAAVTGNSFESGQMLFTSETDESGLGKTWYFNLSTFTLWVGGKPYEVAQEDNHWVLTNVLEPPESDDEDTDNE